MRGTIRSGMGPVQKKARRILVADDEDAMRFLFRVNLPLQGFEVVEAADGETVLALVREQEFDLVLLDVMMPGLSGVDVAEQLGGIPFMFISARADPTDVQRGLELGAVDYITKPFDPIGLGERIETALAAHGRDE